MNTDVDLAGWRSLLRRQEGAVSRVQLLARGLNGAEIAAHLAAGRWQCPIPGVYVTFTGPLPAPTRLWVALLQAGHDACLSHVTAGELWRLLPSPVQAPIHVTVPINRGPRSRRGLVVHRTRLPLEPTGSPPRTSVQATVLTLCAQARRASEITALLGRTAQLYPREFAQVRVLATTSRSLRWRGEILAAAQDVAGGAHSELERRYLVDVELAHGLPAGHRQRAVANTRQDVHYDGFATTIELDGRVAHQSTDTAWRDKKRDNAAALRGETTLRFGWNDVRWHACEVAAEVAAILRANGWQGRPKPCGPGCPVS